MPVHECINVYISEFPENEILEEAREIIEAYQARARDKWPDTIVEAIESIARQLGRPVFDESHLPPASTAARIKSVDELKKLVAKETEH